MSQAAAVSRLALRELWINARLLLLLAAYAAAGATVALLPAPLPATLFRLAVGLAAASIAGAAIAAWSLSRERALGRAAWLATHSIPRATILVGWFVPLAVASILGLLAAGLLGWLSAATSFERLDPLAFGGTLASIATLVLALLALGLLIGLVGGPSTAAVATIISCAVLVTVPWVALPRVALPFEALARLPELARPISVALQGAGAGLAATALLLLVARLVIERVDL